MDKRELMRALQLGLPITEAPVAETESENNSSASTSRSTSPIMRFKSVPIKVEHPTCCGILMGPGDSEHTLKCSRCARTQYEEAPARGGRRTTKETRRAKLIEELTRYNQQYSAKHQREIPFEYLQKAADTFILAKDETKFRDAPGGDHRNSILAAILVYACRGNGNFTESDILAFLRAGGVKAKIQFSEGTRVLRTLHNRGVGGIDLNVDPTRQMMRGNLLFLDLLGSNNRPGLYQLPPSSDLEAAANQILEISEELTISPGVQPKTRTLGIIWFLVMRLQARGYCQELKLRDIKDKCNIGDATITSFQRALEKHAGAFDDALRKHGIIE